MGTIYCIESQTTSKKYVGMTKNNVIKRWNSHKSHARSGGRDYHLYRAMRKYGIDDFVLTTLETCTTSRLVEAEKKWIKKLNTYKDGYNSTEGGEGFGDFKGEPRVTCKSVLTGERFSMSVKEFNKRPDLVGVSRNTVQTAESNKRRGDSLRGFKHTEETKAKLRASIAKRPKPVGNRKKGVISVFNYKDELVASELHRDKAQEMFCRSITTATKENPLGVTPQSKQQLNKQCNLHLVGFYIIKEK